MRSAKSIKRWYAAHKWTSLVSTVFMLIACLTGLPLVFHDEIDRLEGWIGGEVRAGPAEGSAALSIDTLAERARQERPAAHLQLLFREPSDPGVTNFAMGAAPDAPVVSALRLRLIGRDA